MGNWQARIPKDYHVPNRLSSHVVVVTGAASGIGRACAVRYAREGARVVLVDIDPVEGQKALAEVRAVGGAALFQACDVSDPAQVEAALQAGVRAFGYVSAWHNNAFWSVFKDITQQSLEEFDRTVAVSLRGYWLGAKAAVEHIRSRGGRGVILNTASVQSYLGERGFSAYQVAKAGILGLIRSLALDHAPHIRAVGVAPGLVLTPVNAALPGDTLSRVMQQIPAGRGAEPEEIAGLCAFLLSDEADYITGSTVLIDGGYLHAY
jgi:NAD(P)-dependent dehydrogenase (short-subunit alcohol dehydrogenase family)